MITNGRVSNKTRAVHFLNHNSLAVRDEGTKAQNDSGKQ